MPGIFPRFCALLSLTWAAAGAPAALAQEIYRWLDEDGRTHYGMKPPPGSTGVERWRPSEERSINVVPHSDPPPPPPATPRDAGVPAGDPGGDFPGAGPRIGGRYEWQWRKEATRYRSRIETLEAAIEQIQDGLSFPGRFRTSLQAAKHEARQERRIERHEAEIEQVRSDLEELEDQARQLEVPPGWLR